MKSSLKAKLIQHLAAKKGNAGFTLIELLVVIIIIGILSAIALPSFLNQAAKARQSEAKTYVGSVNRAQQAFRLENRQFATSFGELAIGIPEETEYYEYEVGTNGTGGALVNADSLDASVKAYMGAVQLFQPTADDEATALAIVCEKDAAATGVVGAPSAGFDEDDTVIATALACAADSSPLNAAVAAPAPAP